MMTKIEWFIVIATTIIVTSLCWLLLHPGPSALEPNLSFTEVKATTVPQIEVTRLIRVDAFVGESVMLIAYQGHHYLYITRPSGAISSLLHSESCPCRQ